MNHGFLMISGKDANKFLQGQLTCDMNLCAPDTIQLAAHCNPQGRVISLFHLVPHEENYYLYMPEEMIPLTQQALKKYAVFYKVSLDPWEGRLSQIMDELEQQAHSPFIPAIYPQTSGKFLPHELNLDKLHAISFEKGCYTGQEIIARMHYRGKLKTHLHTASVTTLHPPKAGDDIFYQASNETIPAGTLIKVLPDNKDYKILLVCHDESAKNNFLFLNPTAPDFLIFENCTKNS